jgi:hypothetical protein
MAPGIRALAKRVSVSKAWMAGLRPAMTGWVVL